MTGILMLENMNRGNTLKQGDLSILKYRLYDADGDTLNVSGKPATVRLMKKGFTFIAYEKEGLVVSSDDTVSFNINKVLPGGTYYLEVIVDDKYVFPSRGDEGQFNVDRSSLGAELNIVEAAGVEAVARKATSMMKQDEEFIDDMIENVISDTNVGNIEAYYIRFNEATAEFENLKTQTLNSVTKSDKAIVDSASAKSIAQGIDAKATEALSKSTDADALSKSVQSQFNQVVIDGDSSVEAAQARVDASGHTNATLKERLDKEHNETTAQLAQTNLKKANQIGIDVTNPPNGLTPAKANNVTDDTLAINNILLYAEAQGIKNVFIPEGNYRITGTINLFRELQLTLAHNAVIRFVSLTNNIFKMATRSVLKGGKILTSYDFKGSVFYYRGVVSNSTIDGTKCYGTQGTREIGFRDINTGTIVHFDGYYSTGATEDVRMNGYCQYNTVKNVYAQWYGTFLKAVVNLNRPFETNPWFTANTFFNIELERVNRIVDMNVGGANFFDHLRVQCGPQDDLLFSLRGKTDLNRFTNIIYYDLMPQTQIVEMDKSSAHNYFELWYDISEYRAKTINRGYRNRIEAPGAMLEVPKEIPLTAEWAKSTGAYAEPRVFKTKEGIVHIEGVVTNLTKTTGDPFNALIGVLPEGYRPRATVAYSVSGGTATQTNVWINPSNGEIRAYSNTNQIHLSGIAPYRA